MEDIFDTAENAFNMLWLAKTACDCGRDDLLETWADLTLEYDNEPEMVYSGLESVGDFFDERLRESESVCHMYFSSYAMMEYYRLCKQYEQLTGCTARQNPYRTAACEHVDEQMSENGCYYCYHRLATKTCFDWSSYVRFSYDTSSFYEHLALVSRMFNVMAFYSDEVAKLRYEIWKLSLRAQRKVLMLPPPRDEQRRAA